jgi:hypothetical protein
MKRSLIFFVLACTACLISWAQAPESQSCVASALFKPVLVNNPDALVTFACRGASPLHAIESIGRQSRKPIGVLLGEDPTVLTKVKRSFSLTQVDAKSALMAAVEGTGYTVSETEAGFLLTAGDLTPRQRDVVARNLPGLFPVVDATMVDLGVQLSMLLETDLDHPTGFLASILSSTDDEKFSLDAIPPSTVVEIANRIVALGTGGIWILTTDAVQRTDAWTDRLTIEPYQHYSNLPVIE